MIDFWSLADKYNYSDKNEPFKIIIQKQKVINITFHYNYDIAAQWHNVCLQ